MMEKINSRRLPGAGTVLYDTFRRCRSPFILYVAVMLLLGPLGFAFDLMERGESLTRNPWNFPTLAYCGCIVFLGASCVIPMVIFSYLNNRRALDVFHALPVKRETQFTGNILAGLLLLFVPYLAAIFPVAALCDLSYRWSTIGYYSSGAIWDSNLLFAAVVGVIGLTLFMMMSFMMFCCSTIIESAGYFALILFGYVGLLSGGSEMIGSMTFGYSDFGLIDLLIRFSPFGFFTDTVQSSRKQALLFMLQLLLVAALFFFLSFRRALGRKSEQAGGYVYPPVYYIAAGGGSIVETMILALLFDSGVIGLIFAAVCGVLSYIILDAIRNRSLKNITHSLSACGVAAVAFGLFVLSVHFSGTFGYENRVPTAENVVSVSVSSSMANLDEEFTLTDSDSIKEILSFHHSMVDNKDTIRSRTNAALKNYDAFGFDNGENAYVCGVGYVSVHYTLKSGMTLNRNYNNVPMLLAEPLYKAAGSKAYADSIADTLDRLSDSVQGQDGDSVLFVNLSEVVVGSSGQGRSENFTSVSAANFLSALAEDFRARPEGWFVSPDENPVLSVYFNLNGGNYNFNLYAIDQNVLSFLEKYGCCDKNGALNIPKDEGDSEAAYEYTVGVITKDREAEFSAFGRKNIFHFSGSLSNNGGWVSGWMGNDDDNRFYDDYTGEVSPSIEGITGVMDYKTLKELTGLVRMRGFSDEPQDVLFFDGDTYFIQEGNIEKVEALLRSCKAAEETIVF